MGHRDEHERKWTGEAGQLCPGAEWGEVSEEAIWSFLSPMRHASQYSEKALSTCQNLPLASSFRNLTFNPLGTLGS